MKGRFLFFTVAGFIIIIAAITNPDKERHKEAIRVKLNAYLQKSMLEDTRKPNSESEQAGEAMIMMFGDAIISRVIDYLISTDNYVVFSTTKITWNGQTRIIGIGLFGNVYLTGKLDEALSHGLLKRE